MKSYSPTESARLVATVRSGLQFGELGPYADQLELAVKRISVLEGGMRVAATATRAAGLRGTAAMLRELAGDA